MTVVVDKSPIGTDMQVFPSAADLASWVGVCPGSNESAGKRKSGKTRKGNRWARRALCEAAWAAAKAKKS
jgi:transposase